MDDCKNEEDVLAHCLESVSELVDEIIIVDTGSTDHTREISVHRKTRRCAPLPMTGPGRRSAATLASGFSRKRGTSWPVFSDCLFVVGIF